MNRRSVLFMPGNNPGMLYSAVALGADTVIFDLEDAVSIEEKDSARTLVREALTALPPSETEITVRINPTDSPWWQEDLKEILKGHPDGIVIPKASVESVASIESFIETLGESARQLHWILLIESPRDLLNLKEICLSSRRISAIALGGEDYAASLQVKRTVESTELLYARMVIANTAKAFGLDALDTPFTDVDDEEGLLSNMKLSKQLGMNGMLLIGPRQVETVNRFFSPNPFEIDEAAEILRLYQENRDKGLGVFSYRGKMVDAPVVKRAQQIVTMAEKRGLLP